MNDLFKITEEYKSFLRDLRERIRSAQVRAALAVNGELVMLYWQIGAPSLSGSGSTAGARKSSTACPPTCAAPSPR